jgi:hypothetical protein
MSPSQTPQGSPSKSHAPPGAYDLPNVFDNAMKLLPGNNDSPSKNTRSQLQPKSPTKAGNAFGQDADFSEYTTAGAGPGSPRRHQGNEENTPPSSRPGIKTQSSYLTAAQQGRQEAYKTREEPKFDRGLTAKEAEMISKPSVKRLANVTQLCKSIVYKSFLTWCANHVYKTSSTTISTSSATFTSVKPALHNSGQACLSLPRHQRTSTMR